MMWLFWYGWKFQDLALLVRHLFYVSVGPFVFIPAKIKVHRLQVAFSFVLF